MNAAGPTPSRWRNAAICVALIALVFAVFGQVYTHQFIDCDDGNYVYENPMVRAGLTGPGLNWAFTHAYANNWHPLTWLSHMLDCQLFGLNPAWPHVENVLFHALTCAGLFLLLQRMTGLTGRSVFVAAVFAVHPLRVESVAWMAERKDVLSGLFFVLTLLAYVHYAGTRSRGRYGMLLVTFALGLLCKPMLVTVPVVLFLLDWWPLKRKEPAWKLMVEKLPLAALSMAACALTLWAQNGAMESFTAVPLVPRVENAVLSCMIYVRQLFFPVDLAAFYPYPRWGLPMAGVILSFILFGAISALVFWQRRSRPWLAVGWLWYLTMLLPVIGLLQVGYQAHADRYTYLPQIGLYLALTWLIAEWVPQPKVLAAAGVCIIIVLTIGASRQTTYWTSSETLWTHALTCTTNNDLANLDLGNAYLDQGKFTAAIHHYETALEIDSGCAEAAYNLGVVWSKLGRSDQAIGYYEKAVQLNPGWTAAENNLGDLLRQHGRWEDALNHYRSAAQSMPGDPEIHFNLGLTLLGLGHTNEGLVELQKAAGLKPDYAGADDVLAETLYKIGRSAEAVSYGNQAVQEDPKNPHVHYTLGWALLKDQQPEKAVMQFAEAVRLAPDVPPCLNTLAWLYAAHPSAAIRNGPEAIRLATRACGLTKRSDPVMLDTLAVAYAETGNFANAIQTTEVMKNAARAAGDTNSMALAEERLHFYRDHKPVRDSFN